MEAIVLGGLAVLSYAAYLIGKEHGRPAGREQGQEEVRRAIRDHFCLPEPE